MEKQTADIIQECATAAHTGTMRFPDIVGKLLEVGVTRYHADYLRGETTFYTQRDESQIEPLQLPLLAVAQCFEGEAVAQAVRASQQERLPYNDFLRRTMEAGCTGYVVYLDGQRVIYFGRKGEIHLERFPNSAPIP